MLPDWLGHALGLPTTDGGDVAGSLQHHWPWPAWLSVALVLACIAMVVGCYRAESGGTRARLRALLIGLRLSAIAVLLMMIAQWTFAPFRAGPPTLAILIDDSASMDIVDPPDDGQDDSNAADRVRRAGFDRPSRFAKALTLLSEEDSKLLRRLSEHYRVQLYLVSDAVREHALFVGAASPEPFPSLSAQGQSSRLGDALDTVLANFGPTRPMAVLLLSDGITTAGRPLSEAARDAKQKQVRLFTVAIGSQKPQQDAAISRLDVDDVVFLNDLVGVDVDITADGLAGTPATVTLRQRGVEGALDTEEVILPPDGESLRLRLTHQPTEPGRLEYEVEIDALPGELSTDNNRITRVVEVRDAEFRVLLVQSYPSFEFRYLKELLKRDPKVKLDYVLQEADFEFSEVDAEGRNMVLDGFPARREELFAYDVVVFGDVNPTLLGGVALQNIADYVVEAGGGLIFIAGPEFMPRAYANTPLAPLLPFNPSSAIVPRSDQPITRGFRVAPTPIGLASPQMQLGDSDTETEHIWGSLPEMYFAIEPGPLKPTARVLGVATDRLGSDGRPLPVFVAQYLGAGQVVFHGADDTWRWRRRAGDVYFARFWKQTIRALSASRLVAEGSGAEFTAKPREAELGHVVQLRVRFRDAREAPANDDGVTVLLESTGQPRKQLVLHRAEGERALFETTVSPTAAGRYRAIIVEPTLPGEVAAEFDVTSPHGEGQRLAVDAAELRRAAQSTGGRSYQFDDFSKFLSDLGSAKPIAIERLPTTSLWNWWPLVAVLTLLLFTEWTIRKRAGML